MELRKINNALGKVGLHLHVTSEDEHNIDIKIITRGRFLLEMPEVSEEIREEEKARPFSSKVVSVFLCSWMGHGRNYHTLWRVPRYCKRCGKHIILW